MAQESGEGGRLLEQLALVAPGTPLREGFERILRGRTGALVVLGQNKIINQISTGGFPWTSAYTPTALRELAKMDGAIVLDVGRPSRTGSRSRGSSGPGST